MSRERKYTRREFIAATGGAGVALGISGFPWIRRQTPASANRVIVLGMDGMDPVFLERLLKEGRMPNTRRLIERGGFSRLRTSNPPQSPVAWSNFISGTNPGGHGIFDFIVRDPATMVPGFSTSQAEAGSRFMRVGDWQIPLSKGRARNLRKGPTFWKTLGENGVDCTVLRMPANFPPTESEARALAGLGTPDIHGSYGIFSYFTDDPAEKPRSVSGGQVERVAVEDGQVHGALRGPKNTFSVNGAKSDVPFTVYADPHSDSVKIVIQDHELVLKAKEWSDWVAVKFPMLPHLVSTSGICRFYLKSAHGPFALYVSPVNISPADPDLPICAPPGYARELVKDVGLFYTQGMAEDTAALSAGVFDDDEYRAQATFVLDESFRIFNHEFARFRRGFFFFYFSTLDLNQHMFWRTLDRDHPLYSRKLAEKQGDFLPWLYGRTDEAIGTALDAADERTLVLAVSDHGFTSFRRQFNLNSWLMDNGYAQPVNASDRAEASFFTNTDWAATRAYGLGINGLYLNREGREAYGTVGAGEVEALTAELVERLKAVRDPKTGEPIIANVHRRSEVYSGPCVADAPDLVVGYNRNYRASWDTVLGKYPQEHVLDNLDPWSGDHTMDPSFLPGVLLSSRPVAAADPGLEDMAPTILKEFGAPVPTEMTGKAVL